MKKILLNSLMAFSLAGLFSTAVLGDDQFGLGVSVSQNTSTIRGTIDLNDGLRLEPFFGFTYADVDNVTTSTLSLGTALHKMKPISEKINMYYGGFVGISNAKVDTGAGNTSYTNFNLGPVAGVEYAFDPKFTLGAEVNVGFGFGDVSSVNTSSSVLVRYYF